MYSPAFPVLIGSDPELMIIILEVFSSREPVSMPDHIRAVSLETL